MNSLDDSIIGEQLRSGWTITERRRVEQDGSGGYRSLSYVARRGNELAFVKILDPRVNPTALDSLTDLAIRLDSFLYERTLIEKCTTRRMSRVIRGIEYGELPLSGPSPVTVHYLLFEWADSDLRSQIDVDERFDLSFAVGVLHNTATALKQLHWSDVAHQDVRPANVLVLSEIGAKLGDLGHARDRTIARPDGEIHCDPIYSCPERLYGIIKGDFEAARAADLYQLGSLIVYLFTSVGSTVQLSRRLSPIHHWSRWNGSYDDVLPILRSATEGVLDELAQNIPELVRDDLVSAARQLIEPNPDRRGHPTNLTRGNPKYSLERYISLFDRLKRRADISLKKAIS